MTTQLIDRQRIRPDAQVARRLLVVWRNPSTRRFATIGQLDQLEGGRFTFSYSSSAAKEQGFFPLDEFPDLRKVYESETLPVFFTNRVMSVGRASYGEYLSRLGIAGLPADDVPMEVLARTGGGRATDTFHILEAPPGEKNEFSSRFFVSGIRHIDGALALVRSLHAGAELELRPDPMNEANPRAVLIDAADDRPIGWVPDWLCNQVRTLMEDGFELRATVDQVNADAPARLQVLCRVDVIRRQPDK